MIGYKLKGVDSSRIIILKLQEKNAWGKRVWPKDIVVHEIRIKRKKKSEIYGNRGVKNKKR